MGGGEGGAAAGGGEKGQSHQPTAPLKGSLEGCGGPRLCSSCSNPSCCFHEHISHELTCLKCANKNEMECVYDSF